MARTLKPQDQIAHYRIVGPLGAGGMGEVYRARDQSLPRDVALKILPPELVQSEERVRRFTLEAESASSLNHPHIVTIYEIGKDRVRSTDGSADSDSALLHYIAMELVSGTTLAVKIHEEKTDLKRLLGWLAQAAEGVAKAHAAGIVHRDLKPGNIMISADGYAKVLDFGLAKLTEHPSQVEMSGARTVAVDGTSDGLLLGTAGYMAPEQVRGQAVDARADVFAFGCILYEAATRTQPFQADSKVEMLHRILNDVPSPVESLNPEAPAELRRLIRRCLAKDPSQRGDSMRTLALELREIVEEYDELSTATRSVSIAGAMPRRPRTGWIAASSIAVIVAVAVIVASGWLRRGTKPLNAAMRTRQIEVPMKTIRYPGFSADGNWIALPARNERDQWGLYYMNIQGGEVRPIVSDVDGTIGGADISPDGTRIAFYVSKSLTEYELRVVSVLGGSVRTIARQALGARWAPDGQRIGYLVPVWASRSRRLELWTVKPDGSNLTLAFADSMTENANRLSFAWSPDGKQMAWLRSFEGSDYNEIIIRDLASGRERQITHDRKVIDEVTWTPQNEILFSSDRGGATNIWLIGTKGGTPIQVTRGAGPDLGIRISADGRSMLYLVKEQLMRVGWWDTVTGKEGRVTRDDQPYLAPQPSPDGRQLAVIVQDPDALRSGALVVVDRESGERRTLLPAESKPGVFDWSPDGRQIVWARSQGALGDSLDLQFVDVSTGEASSPARVVATHGYVSWLFWTAPDTLLIMDHHGSFEYALSTSRSSPRSPDEAYQLPLRVPGWIAFMRGPASSPNPGLYLQSTTGGPERLVMKWEWVCSQPTSSDFLYCWPESLGLSRLDLPSGHLSRPPHLPSELRRGMLFFPTRDGRIVFWGELREVSKLALVENLRK